MLNDQVQVEEAAKRHLPLALLRDRVHAVVLQGLLNKEQAITEQIVQRTSDCLLRE